ncbi:MAG: ribosome hibernation-promoting factor, HPF/YfiA family [Gammaproteobacteria bacterium]
MQIRVTGHHVEITPALQSYVRSKLARLQKHFDGLNTMHVVLTVASKLEHRADATLRLRGNQLFAYATAGDMYAAIDALGDKLTRQVTKHKEKLTDHSDRESVRTEPAS